VITNIVVLRKPPFFLSFTAVFQFYSTLQPICIAIGTLGIIDPAEQLFEDNAKQAHAHRVHAVGSTSKDKSFMLQELPQEAKYMSSNVRCWAVGIAQN
jgi:hypothetical protein